MIESVLKYHELGFNVIPTKGDKRPNGEWKAYQDKFMNPDLMRFQDKSTTKGIGVICGKTSGGLECIDIDAKYDITGTLIERYKEEIHKHNPNLLKKLVVQKSVSGGLHFLYRCDNYEGNKKLANRLCTDEEKEKEPNDKTRVLIETRGQGGYFCAYPTEGYSFVYQDLSKIQHISNEERDLLILCAGLFNEVPEEPKREKKERAEGEYNKDLSSPFDDFAKRGDIIPYFEEQGWKLVFNMKDKYALRRPNATSIYSGYVFKDSQVFYAHSTSTVFEAERPYTAAETLAKLKFNDNLGDTARYLLSQGFGEYKKTEEKPIFEKKKIDTEDDDFSFIASIEDADDYLNKKRNGTFVYGRETGYPEFDKYYRFKDAQFEMILGHDNSGKTIITLYLAVLDALFYDTKYAFYAGENSVGGIKVKLMEYYLFRKVENMTEGEVSKAKSWVESHFILIRNDESWTYRDMLAMGKKLGDKYGIKKMIIETYNVLEKETTNEHQYDYKAMLDMRIFIKKTGIGITLNIHAATEALRKVYPKDHDWAGYTMPPNKADAEGGGKFPNKADNFLVVHRMADHPNEWMWTEIHVQKIKEMETGGQRTFKNFPFKLRLCHGGCGFEDVSGFNPVLSYWEKQYKPSALRPSPDFNLPIDPISTPRQKTDKEEMFPDPPF